MIRLSMVAAVLLCLSGCQDRDVWVVRPDGVGPVRVGMSLSELNAALKEDYSIPDNEEERSCFYVGPVAKHQAVTFMIEEGHVARIDVDTGGTATPEGIQVGDSEARVMQVYGKRLKVERHAYNGPNDHYLTVQSSDRQHATRFETYEGKITNYYAGKVSAISYIEGCQ